MVFHWEATERFFACGNVESTRELSFLPEINER